MISLSSVALLCLLAQGVQGSPPSRPPVDVQLGPAAVTVRQLTYAQLDGTRNAATLVTPAIAGTSRPAILFLHWYEPPRPTSNRTEFLAEATELAGSGVVSLLVDTPWTAEDWFATRDAARDFEFTGQMTSRVRRALDVLLAQPGIDATRVAVVGHDFGAMWGALAAAADPRVTHFVYMAGTRSFTDWYLFTPKETARKRTPSSRSSRRSIRSPRSRKSRPVPCSCSSAPRTSFVKNEAAQAMADAVTGPKTFKTYEFEHELTYQARRRPDRVVEGTVQA